MHPASQRLRLSLAAALVAVLFVVAPASAANTRDVYFGSPSSDLANCDAATGYCPLTNSLVTLGGATAIPVVIRNEGGQTLNHVVVYGGAIADQTAGTNPLFPAPTGPSLPSGDSFATVYGTSLCTISSLNAPADSLTCSIGQMRKHSSLTFTVVVDVNATATTAPWLMVGLNEGSSSTGSNEDTFFAVGSYNQAAAPGCSLVATYAQHVNLSTGAFTCAQTTSLSSGTTFGSGAPISVGLDPSNNWCPSGITTCMAGLSLASVNGGATLSSYLLWDVTWDPTMLTSNPKGVIHFLDGYTPGSSLYVPIYFTGKYACKTATATDCWVSAGYNAAGLYEVKFRTPSNGGGRLF